MLKTLKDIKLPRHFFLIFISIILKSFNLSIFFSYSPVVSCLKGRVCKMLCKYLIIMWFHIKVSKLAKHWQAATTSSTVIRYDQLSLILYPVRKLNTVHLSYAYPTLRVAMIKTNVVIKGLSF